MIERRPFIELGEADHGWHIGCALIASIFRRWWTAAGYTVEEAGPFGRRGTPTPGSLFGHDPS